MLKIANNLADRFAKLPLSYQCIILEDLSTAFESRISAMEKALASDMRNALGDIPIPQQIKKAPLPL